MSELSWSDPNKRFFESGIDRVAIYVRDEVGMPWNGVSSIAESVDGGEPQGFYVDGFKYANIVASEEFTATITAFSKPENFAQCEGYTNLGYGFFAGEQKRVPFDLTYRSYVGNALKGVESDYKLHFIYNSLVQPSDREYKTLGEEADLTSFEWSISTRPVRNAGIKPTSHFVLDTRYSGFLLAKALEDILYGTVDTDPRMPTISEIRSIMGNPPRSEFNYFMDPRFNYSPAVGLNGGTIDSPGTTNIYGGNWLVFHGNNDEGFTWAPAFINNSPAGPTRVSQRFFTPNTATVQVEEFQSTGTVIGQSEFHAINPGETTIEIFYNKKVAASKLRMVVWAFEPESLIGFTAPTIGASTYFDGYTEPTLTASYGWSGLANTSTSYKVSWLQ